MPSFPNPHFIFEKVKVWQQDPHIDIEFDREEAKHTGIKIALLSRPSESVVQFRRKHVSKH